MMAAAAGTTVADPNAGNPKSASSGTGPTSPALSEKSAAAASQFPTSAPVSTAVRYVLQNPHGKGLQIRNSFARRQNTLFMDLTFENTSSTALPSFAVKFNTNYLGVSPNALLRPGTLNPGQSLGFSLPLKDSSDPRDLQGSSTSIQMAIRTELGIAYFQDTLDAYFLFDDNGRVEKSAYSGTWRSMPDSKEMKRDVPSRLYPDITAIAQRLCAHNVFFVAARTVAQRGDVLYFSLLFKGLVMLLEVTINGPSCTAIIKSERPDLSAIALSAVQTLLTTPPSSTSA